jgi:putative transposase
MATLVRGIIAHGSPDVVYLDNGKDFRMRKFSGGRPRKDEGNIVDEHRVKPLLETLGIRPTFANPYNAKAKPIEPWFKLFAEWFSKTWETYIGNKPERRPEHFKELHGRAEEFARKGYTLESFRQAFNQWVTGDY